MSPIDPNDLLRFMTYHRSGLTVYIYYYSETHNEFQPSDINKANDRKVSVIRPKQ